MNALTDNLFSVEKRLQALADEAKCAPPLLVAVSKTFPADDIRTLYQAGQRDFGENYLQEFAEKAANLADLEEIRWHIIGHIQSNKSRIAAEHASWVHTIDRLKIAERLSAQRPSHLTPLQVLLEINISGEAAKHGIAPNIDEVVALAFQVAQLPRLSLRGLMCVAAAGADDAALTKQFTTMRQLLQALQQQGLAVDTLSMGMSNDLAHAIAEGSTMVRVGTAIFGHR